MPVLVALLLVVELAALPLLLLPLLFAGSAEAGWLNGKAEDRSGRCAEEEGVVVDGLEWREAGFTGMGRGRESVEE